MDTFLKKYTLYGSFPIFDPTISNSYLHPVKSPLTIYIRRTYEFYGFFFKKSYIFPHI